MPEKSPNEGFVPTLDAAAATARLLAEAGLDMDPSEDDVLAAAGVVDTVARSAQGPSTAELMRMTPSALLMVKQLLMEFGHKVVDDAEKVRHLVVNKLVIETSNPDPRVRMRALEMLGKMGDVSLFTEKKEVTITHQTSGEVRERLRARLARLIPSEPETIPEAELVEDAATAAETEAAVEEEVDDDDTFELSLEPRAASRSLFDD